MKLKALAEENDKRRELAGLYRKRINHPEVQLPEERKEGRGRVSPESRPAACGSDCHSPSGKQGEGRGSLRDDGALLDPWADAALHRGDPAGGNQKGDLWIDRCGSEKRSEIRESTQTRRNPGGERGFETGM